MVLNDSLVTATCGVASRVTLTLAFRLATVAPFAVDTFTAALLLVSWVVSPPLSDRVVSALANPVMPDFSSDTADTCAVSVSACRVSRAFLLANCASTRLLTSAAVSTPDPAPSALARLGVVALVVVVVLAVVAVAVALLVVIAIVGPRSVSPIERHRGLNL